MDLEILVPEEYSNVINVNKGKSELQHREYVIIGDDVKTKFS